MTFEEATAQLREAETKQENAQRAYAEAREKYDLARIEFSAAEQTLVRTNNSLRHAFSVALQLEGKG